MCSIHIYLHYHSIGSYRYFNRFRNVQHFIVKSSFIDSVSLTFVLLWFSLSWRPNRTISSHHTYAAESTTKIEINSMSVNLLADRDRVVKEGEFWDTNQLNYEYTISCWIVEYHISESSNRSFISSPWLWGIKKYFEDKIQSRKNENNFNLLLYSTVINYRHIETKRHLLLGWETSFLFSYMFNFKWIFLLMGEEWSHGVCWLSSLSFFSNIFANIKFEIQANVPNFFSSRTLAHNLPQFLLRTIQGLLYAELMARIDSQLP